MGNGVLRARRKTAGNGSPPKAQESLEEPAFCAAVKGRKTYSAKSEKLAEVLPLAKNASIAWIDCVVPHLHEETVGIAVGLGFSELLVQNLFRNTRSGYVDFDSEFGIMIPAIHIVESEVFIEPLVILMRKDLLVTLHKSETKRLFRIRRYAENLLGRLSGSQLDRMGVLLFRILDENNARNFDYLQVIEEHGDRLSQDLADHTVSRLAIGHKIHQTRHALIVYLGGLWATVDALVSLRYGDAQLISDNPKILDRLNGLVNEVHAQIGLAEHLSDVLASGLEVLQSIYNNQLQILNNRLAMLVAYLTIIGTAVLVPNTIATVLSNPMFVFHPADESWYLSLIALSTLVATFFAWWIVKRMGLLPARPDSNG